ncbi:protocatechuate 3,4-dioxygenase [Sphingomonas cavernae]|uniref:Protocatechuate 3,4-dioxygenase n=2 Tax=Sphingomonas cavernae TaxID=2320861 RepID=A0A418W810_9SPHN|nr:protocatechuate 3,4-dioxygenase [Sphingomonas cavernae]
MTIGPFYPVLRPLDQDGDLTVVNGIATGARGQIVDLAGRVLKPDGTPAAGARVEIWQANAAGRYAHPADMSGVPLDPGFQGFGVQLADAEGRYRFRTVKPGAYRIPDGRVRTPHIHFDVQGRTSRIVSQMFVPGEPLNASDFLLKASEAPDTLIARKLQPPPGTADILALEWDIVLVAA